MDEKFVMHLMDEMNH